MQLVVGALGSGRPTDLHDVTLISDAVDVGDEVIHGLVRCRRGEHHKGVAPRGEVLLLVEEVLDDVRGVGDHELALGELVDGVDGEDGVPAHERVAVLEVREDARDQRLQDLFLCDLAEEAQRLPPEELVGVLQVVAEVLADEDHLGQDLPVGGRLLDGLEVQEQQLLDVVVVAGKHVADDGDEEPGELLPVEHAYHELLHRHDLRVVVVALERLLELVGARGLVEVHQHGAALLHAA